MGLWKETPQNIKTQNGDRSCQGYPWALVIPCTVLPDDMLTNLLIIPEALPTGSLSSGFVLVLTRVCSLFQLEKNSQMGRGFKTCNLDSEP